MIGSPVTRSRLLLVGLVGTLALGSAACGGSALSPDEVLSANAQVRGGGTGTVGGDGTDVGTGGDLGTGTDAGTGTDTGTGGGTGTGTGAGAGSGSGTGSGSGSGTGAGSGSGSGGGAAAGGAVRAASCNGFKNSTGITDSTIKLGNSSDLSGPVPGLFTGAQLATKAYVEYFNKTNPNGICGRKLELTNLDSRTDAGADQASYTKMCDTVFAAVGSMSAFDSGGAGTAQSCGLPDIRSAMVTAARNRCATCFAAQNTGDGEYTNAVYDFWIQREKGATQKAAMAYLNAGAAAENAATQIAVGKKRGMNWVYTTGIDVADFNYGPYVQQMKSKGVEFVQFLGAYQQSVRMAQAMQSANFKPKVLMYDPSVYDQGFLKTGGSAIEGAYMFINFLPLNSNQPELNLYRQWLGQVSPGAEPTFFGLYSWSAAKLFVENALALGGNLTRASLANRLKTVRKWTGGGSHAPMDVGGKHAPSCIRYMVVKNNKFVPAPGSTSYLCRGYTKA